MLDDKTQSSAKEILTKHDEGSVNGVIVSSKIDCMDLLKKLKTNKHLINIGNKNDDSGSDTDNSQDNIPVKEIKSFLPQSKLVNKKKKKKTNNEMLKKKLPSMSTQKREGSKPITRSDTADNAQILPEISKNDKSVPQLKISNKHLRAQFHIPKERFVSESQREGYTSNNFTEEDDNSNTSPILSPQRQGRQSSLFKLQNVDSTNRDWILNEDSMKYQPKNQSKVHFYIL